MTIEDLIKQFGGPSAMASAMGVTRQAIYYWRWKGKLPRLRQMQAEMILEDRSR
jgi:hypothetical protein